MLDHLRLFINAYMNEMASSSEINSNAVVATTTRGPVVGTRHCDVARFLGIPYAQQPIGGLRFQPPKPPAPWAVVTDCRNYGAACPQINNDLPAWRFNGLHAESCLNLNIWTPHRFDEATQSSGRSAPVMVWLHGGAFVSGTANLPIYDGGVLAGEQSVVVVSINHRLNAFGYLYLDDVAPYLSNSANLGQQDIIMALAWIQENIDRFGGDPGNVTLFGESGGGAKITSLAMSPSSRGLYHKAIVQSGSFFTTLTVSEARTRAERFHCLLSMSARSSSPLISCSTDEVLTAANQLIDEFGFSAFWPVNDGRIVDLESAQCTDALPRVPMLIGTTRDEAAYFLSEDVLTLKPSEFANYRVALAERYRDIGSLTHGACDAAEALLGECSDDSSLCRDVTDLTFWLPAIAQAEKNSLIAPTFMYRFDWQFKCLGGQYSIHAAEIPFIFGSLDYESPAWDSDDLPGTRYIHDLDNERYRLGMKMRQSWANFAKTGNPSVDHFLKWDSYTIDNRITFIFDRICKIICDPESHRRKLMMK